VEPEHPAVLRSRFAEHVWRAAIADPRATAPIGRMTGPSPGGGSRPSCAVRTDVIGKDKDVLAAMSKLTRLRVARYRVAARKPAPSSRARRARAIPWCRCSLETRLGIITSNRRRSRTLPCMSPSRGAAFAAVEETGSARSTEHGARTVRRVCPRDRRLQGQLERICPRVRPQRRDDADIAPRWRPRAAYARRGEAPPCRCERDVLPSSLGTVDSAAGLSRSMPSALPPEAWSSHSLNREVPGDRRHGR